MHYGQFNEQLFQSQLRRKLVYEGWRHRLASDRANILGVSSEIIR